MTPHAPTFRRRSGGPRRSNGHYEVHNLQIVCQFVNFWKGDSDNDDFKRLLALVQREGGSPPQGAVRTSPTEGEISLMAKPLAVLYSAGGSGLTASSTARRRSSRRRISVRILVRSRSLKYIRVR